MAIEAPQSPGGSTSLTDRLSWTALTLALLSAVLLIVVGFAGIIAAAGTDLGLGGAGAGFALFGLLVAAPTILLMIRLKRRDRVRADEASAMAEARRRDESGEL